MALDLQQQQYVGAAARPRRSGAPGPGAARQRDPWQPSMLGARIVVAAIIVLGQLWALTYATVALESGGNRSRVWWFIAFEAVSFAVAFALWASDRRAHR